MSDFGEAWVWVLDRRPVGPLSGDEFRLERRPLPPPRAGELAVRHLHLSIDPGNRIWLSDRDWLREHDEALQPVAPGTPMVGATISMVERSEDGRFAPGDVVQPALSTWSDRQIVDAATTTRIELAPGVPPAAHLGILGHTGMTAYLGVVDVARVSPGQTFAVTAASGAVGSAAGQIAKLLGARTVGITGGATKARRLIDRFGFDEGLDALGADPATAVAAACPRGVDAWFENVGGGLVDIGLASLRVGGRMALCGLLADYDRVDAPAGPRRFADVLMKRLTVSGFGLFDFDPSRRAEAGERLRRWVAEGALIYDLEEVDGLEGAPGALVRAINGGGGGKLVVRVSRV